MSSPVEELCARYRYPDALRDVLREVVAAAQEAYPHAISFILSGSASTGDYVYRQHEGRVELISDLDMTLITNRKGARPERLARVIAAIKERQPSPLFQIDIAVSPVSALRNIEPGFQMVETKLAGVVLAGDDVLENYPDHFDSRAARRSFLLNLWKPVLYWIPAGGDHDLTYTQVAARFFLDLPLLVAAEQGQCIPGHSARADAYLNATKRDGLFSESLRENVRWALEARREASQDRRGLERAVAAFAFEVAEALDGVGPIPRDPDRALVKRLAAWLPPRAPRRMAAELRSIVRDPRHPVIDFNWLRGRKEAMGGAALLGLLSYLSTKNDGVIIGDPPPGVGARLGEFSRQPELLRGQGETELEFIYRAKEAYWDGLTTLYPSLGKKEAGFDAFLHLRAATS